MNVCATSCTPVLEAIYDWYLRIGGPPYLYSETPYMCHPLEPEHVPVVVFAVNVVVAQLRLLFALARALLRPVLAPPLLQPPLDLGCRRLYRCAHFFLEKHTDAD